MRGWAVSINGASPVRASGTHLLLQISSIAMRTGGREAITASARSRLASALSFMCSKRMIPVRGGVSRASIRVGREFVRLGRRSIFRHMARKRRWVEQGVGRIRSGRERELILIRRGIHDGLLYGTLRVQGVLLSDIMEPPAPACL